MNSLIDSIGPALRGLFGTCATLPQIRFTDQRSNLKSLKVALAEDAPPAKILETLRKVVDRADDSTRALYVEGVGTFEVQPMEPSRSGRAAGKVAVVTGAAQGFGLEIAQHLASEGATVILADLNEAGAQAAARELNQQIGAERALGLAVNVTDGASIATALSEVVRAFGGVDLFIANAGVLKAESVKTQSEKDFDFVSTVNYKGYFLCVQKVAPILAMQHRACPDYRSDIIQINSKSGLVGSNRNGAYAGSKFGGIGLTQSFALELVADGIKVNSICPGNFFDGPLWSNPENGLFVQYLRTNKVPGAKTLEDVRRFYEAKVPMGRGCTTPDVMKAVYYLMEQQYETGQAVPVTGGQVMLH
jgi:sorbitol-6-phosphate 2-dehydrogenase